MSAPGLALLIGGVDYTDGPGWHANLTDLTCSEEIVNKGGSLATTVTIEYSGGAPAIPVPEGNQETLLGLWDTSGVYTPAHFTPIWGGILAPTADDFARSDTGAAIPHVYCVQVQANSYKRWLDRDLVAAFWPAGSRASDIVMAVAQAARMATGASLFTANGVQVSGPTDATRGDYDYPSAIIQGLADKLGWGWYIDERRDVNFYDWQTNPAPVATWDADSADPTETAKGGDLQLGSNPTQFRNFIVVKGHKILAGGRTPIAIPYRFVSDGTDQSKTFSLPQQPGGSSERYFPHPTGSPGVDVYAASGGGGWAAGHTLCAVLADGTGATLAGTSSTQNNTAYVSRSQSTIRFNVAPPAGAVISGLMYYRIDAITPCPDSVLIAQTSAAEVAVDWASGAYTNTDGVYQFKIDDPRMSYDDDTVARGYAFGQMMKYSRPPNLRTASFGSYVQGWRAGQVFTLTTERMGLNRVPTTVYVTRCMRRIVNTDANGVPVWHYDLEIADRPYVF